VRFYRLHQAGSQNLGRVPRPGFRYRVLDFSHSPAHRRPPAQITQPAREIPLRGVMSQYRRGQLAECADEFLDVSG
jgi:hypothetical protein